MPSVKGKRRKNHRWERPGGKMLWSRPEIWSAHMLFTLNSLQETTLHIESRKRYPSQVWRVPFTVWRLFRALPVMKIKHRSITLLWKYDNLPMPDKPKMIFLEIFKWISGMEIYLKTTFWLEISFINTLIDHCWCHIRMDVLLSCQNASVWSAKL